MNFALLFDINIFSIFVLLVIYASLVIRKKHLSTSNRIFIVLIFSTVAVLLLEMLSWYFNDKTTPMDYFLNKWINYIFITINPLVCVVWLNYLDYKIYNSLERLSKRFYYAIFMVLSVIFVTINLKTPWIYGFTPENQYYRGPGIYFFMSFNFFILFLSAIPVIKKRKFLDSSIIISYLFFTIFPILGAIVQMIFLGTAVLWNSVTIAILGTFAILELKNLSKDFLTGLSNRRELEDLIDYRLRYWQNIKPFILIMIDLNDFKTINDLYGHKEGDSALKHFANIILPIFKKSDIVCRFGGDEFVVVIDSDQEFMINAGIERIRKAVNDFNLKEIKDYKLKFSAGGTMFDPKRHKSIKDILHEADSKMYNDKKNTKISSDTPEK